MESKRNFFLKVCVRDKQGTQPEPFQHGLEHCFHAMDLLLAGTIPPPELYVNLQPPRLYEP